MTEVYWIGKTVVVEWALTDLDGAAVTDATVTGTITLPDETTAAATIAHESGSGTYRATYEPVGAGTHAYRLEATGTVESAEEGTFEVRPSPTVGPAPTLDPATTVGQVRLLIPDKDPALLLFTDADISGFLALEGSSVKKAAALALETIASSEAMVSKVLQVQDLSTDGAKVADALMKRAAMLRQQADDEDPAIGGGLDIVDFVDPHTRWSAHELAEWES
ncbi:hypothetical protein BJF79_13810 [Actinomadura sp. CNU-125]|uniref:hypothetical protein n=1 Tax=Actinomadura sp. CNU-125 TaxID=1904961 RepID=UPI0009633760|nr:hypothetical protein [Actinomadura sp. CNU-125]OLT24413.1 hypothetical protein BJF79_13810 [Actinomadura sp. CNU-125]